MDIRLSQRCVEPDQSLCDRARGLIKIKASRSLNWYVAAAGQVMVRRFPPPSSVENLLVVWALAHVLI
jgi:hypothetical protein